MILTPPRGSCVSTLSDAFRKHSEVILGPGEWIMDGQVEIGPTCTVFRAQEGAILVSPEDTPDRANFLIRNRRNVPLLVEGIKWVTHIPHSNTNQHALWYVIDTSHVTLSNLTVEGLKAGHAIDVRAASAGITDILIQGCRMTARPAEASDTGRNIQTGGATGLEVIKLTGNVSRSTGQPPLAHWKATHDAGSCIYPVEAILLDNYVDGGYYAISMEGCQRCYLRGNTVVNTMRGISAQNQCTNNLIAGNSILENLSAGIHLAYGSSYNVIWANTIQSHRAHGEGLLQAYVGSGHNLFWANTLSSDNPERDCCKFYLYCAVDSPGNMFYYNDMKGTCARAYVAVEQDWDPSTKDSRSRAFNTPSDAGHFAAGPLEGTVMWGNSLVEESRAAPATFYGSGVSVIDENNTWSS